MLYDYINLNNKLNEQLNNNIENLTILIILRNIYIRSISIYFHFMDKIIDFSKIFFLINDNIDNIQLYNNINCLKDDFSYDFSYYDFLLIINDIKKYDFIYIDHHVDEQSKYFNFLLNFCFKEIKFLLIDEKTNTNNNIFKTLNIKRNKDLFNKILNENHINKTNQRSENNLFLGKTKYSELKNKNYIYYFNEKIYDLVESFYFNDFIFFKKNNIVINKNIDS